MGGASSKSTVNFGKHSTAKDIIDAYPDSVSNRLCIVTGGNSGIGTETVKALLSGGARVILCTRSLAKGQKAIEEEILKPGLGGYVVDASKCILKELDLMSLPSIKAFADDVLTNEANIDLLILNAGIMMPPTATYSENGWESQMATNHFGHYYLTSLLLPKMMSQETKSRIVVVSSLMHANGKVDVTDLHYKNGRKYSYYSSYGQSKLANVLFAKSLADKLKNTNITPVSLHPGVIETNLIQHSLPTRSGPIYWVYKNFIIDKTIPQGASTTLYASIVPEVENQPGEYFSDCGVGKISNDGKDENKTLREALWRVTKEQLDSELMRLNLPISYDPSK